MVRFHSPSKKIAGKLVRRRTTWRVDKAMACFFPPVRRRFAWPRAAARRNCAWTLWDGAPEMQGLDPLPGTSRYYRGNAPGQWITEAPSFARVSYRDVYPGIDLVFYGKDQYLEYDFLVAPKANPRSIRLAFAGADRLRIDGGGDLVLHLGGGEVRMLKPVAYQDVAGQRRKVNVNYSVRGKHVGFLVGAYDAAHPLVIDPVLTYSSYLGGGGMDGATAVAVDAAGNGILPVGPVPPTSRNRRSSPIYGGRTNGRLRDQDRPYRDIQTLFHLSRRQRRRLR